MMLLFLLLPFMSLLTPIADTTALNITYRSANTDAGFAIVVVVVVVVATILLRSNIVIELIKFEHIIVSSSATFGGKNTIPCY